MTFAARACDAPLNVQTDFSTSHLIARDVSDAHHIYEAKTLSVRLLS